MFFLFIPSILPSILITISTIYPIRVLILKFPLNNKLNIANIINNIKLPSNPFNHPFLLDSFPTKKPSIKNIIIIPIILIILNNLYGNIPI